MKNEIITYEPNQRAKVGFFRTLSIMLQNVIHSRELIWQLFRRDFLMSYKKSFLGIAWIFISPIVGIISWVFMNATGILNPGDVGIPYPAYVLFSSSLWGLFMGFYSSAAGTLDAGAGFVMQVKYPHEALFAKQIVQHLANFLLGFFIIIVFLLIFGVVPNWKIIFFPILIFPLFFLGAGMGLVSSVVSVVAIDIRKVFDTALGLLMYITPVIYSNQINSDILQKIMTYNPLTYLFGNVRDVILYGTFEHPNRFFYSTIFASFVFLLSCRLFYISEEKVIEKMI